MMRYIFYLGIAVASGGLFGLGLVISGMTDPNKVLGFLDILGEWDASLMFVMGGGLIVYLPGYRFWVKKRQQPWCESRFHLPVNHKLDLRLITGAAIFGIGWGLVGFCPGPAVASLVSGSETVIIFVLSMLAGLKLATLLTSVTP